MGSGCSREVLKTLKSEVARSFSVVSPLRCDPMRGQRGKQKSDVDFNDAGKDVDRNSVAGRDAASCPSGMASTMVSSARALMVTQCNAYSSPEAAGCGAGMCRTSSGRASSKTLSSACSSPVASGRGCVAPFWIRFAKRFSVECFDDDSEWCVFESWCFWTWC